MEELSNTYSVAEALEALGNAYRFDWSGFDGRSLQFELGELAEALRTNSFNLDAWFARQGICRRCKMWNEDCVCDR